VQELIDAGALAMKTPGRGVDQNVVEPGQDSFVITARAQGEEAHRWPVLTINKRMEIGEQAPATGKE
jgi:hypothetical protein